MEQQYETIVRNGIELASWSVDNRQIAGSSQTQQALFVPTVRLTHRACLDVVAGTTLVALFRDARVQEIDHHATWSYVWGDFMMYRTGEPEIRNMMMIRGQDMHMQPGQVSKFLKLFLPRKSA
jgi:hypothetical protein